MMGVVKVFEITSNSHNRRVRVRVAACADHACHIFSINLRKFELHKDNVNCFSVVSFCNRGFGI